MNQFGLCLFLIVIASYSFYRHIKFIQSRTLPKWKKKQGRHHHTARTDADSALVNPMESGITGYSVADNDSHNQALEQAA